ncbi:hypothetical protein PFAG_02790 [Plasmodium falciparum Santa Lucia]|nr:hypothetical protein PFNF135_02960 [Plasmodium falciparum NF135/5.C10]ETW49101.1 hypothetical protein PFMALIP_02804 [Plasmodium falciparum MaliPS096_E11]ETW56536.1 hypothetical protein PFUGPA_01326 [Plasmodium falciparum Palo Alto/Uganda]ETW61362.1 hypothetical protein PFMC_02782 [Plasmodium falciparum CAMP/Malaysia]EUR71854.1 hypothetical protein PFBG_02880 [Plasmodium falciparum 7G8]EUT85757.1 hypothetical protein PFAG_02790 [Plasmodium falciparum Santa Lucia]EWC76433.1 hypothetical prot
MSYMNNFQRVIYASRFMRVFGKFKRAQLREKPQRKIGPFCNPVKRLVRLKEKERLFCEIGLPRMIPRAKVRESEKLLEVIEAPKVKKEVLERRLEFLLSNESVYQQLYNKMYNGITPYQCELYMWERQMRDLRKVYRAQYLHKLSEVTNEEREKQLKLLLQTKEDKRKRRQEIRERILQDKKRRAILKDRLCLEKKVTQSILFKRQSNRKKKNIYWLMKLQQKSTYLNELDFKNKIEQTNQENDPLFNRNISVSSLYKNLGYQTKEDKNENTKVFKVDKVYRKLLEDSFEFLEEDEEQYEQNFVENINDPNHVSHKQRAHILYSSFTNEEKIKLLDDKIAILTKTIEQKSFSKEVQNNDLMFYIQLKDKLEASKQAFLEKNYLKDVQKVQ